MSSTSSFDWSNASCDDRGNVHDASLSSPRSSFSSQISPRSPGEDVNDDGKSHKRHSFIHLQPGLRLPEEDTRSLSVQTMKEERSILLDPHQNTVEALEERIRSLESRLTQNGYLQFQGSTEDGDGLEKPHMITEPQWLTWHEYCKPIKRPSNMLEVLVERPHTRRKFADDSVLNLSRPVDNPLKNIKRIRIRSHHIINALQLITEHTFEDTSCLTLHQPFKILLFYQKEIEAYLAQLENIYDSRDHPDFCQGSAEPLDQDSPLNNVHVSPGHPPGDADAEPIVDIASESLPVSEKRQYFASFEEEESPTLPHNGRSDISGFIKKKKHKLGDSGLVTESVDDSMFQEEAILHLRALVTFTREDMGPLFERHRLLRSSKAETVSFDELWHLFMPGDLVVGDDEQNPRLYRVCIVPPSERYAKLQTVKEVRLHPEGQAPRVEETQREASIQCFNIDVFHFDYDGVSYGPVESRVTIVDYKGEKNIVDLPFYPVRFRKDASIYKAKMAQRGARFLKLSTETTAHREYDGLSVEEPREHIDSQVIIDGNLAYRMHPKKAPKFGLKSWMESNGRVVREACDVPGCTACNDFFKNRLMFDDHRIDRRRTFDFIRANRSLLRTVNDTSELTEDLILLLPNSVQGFVLRSRQWYALEIASIRPIERHTEGFDSLILPKGVARLVEGLVQTHDPQKTFSSSSDNVEQKHQVDLVRGKGKGLIILLHGAPGVGKTSTAECVAEYTQRPLFPITCGDIGETAKEVEANLKQNFDLAYRWGCVLLLDEADVFLQARDKEDMRRNSVVSVFLRVLEYYPGILILTTNKVGFFDEAFKSRIHIALYYPPLSKSSTKKIWKMNLKRLIANHGTSLIVDRDDIKAFAKEHYKKLHKAKRATWNGRQIKNAFQTAIAIAEFESKTENPGEQPAGNEARPIELKREHFEVVARAYEGFDNYLSRIHGQDADRALRAGERDGDEIHNGEVMGGSERSRSSLSIFPLGKQASKKREDSSESSGSSSSEEEDVKEHEKEKSRSKKQKKGKKHSQKSDSSSSSEDSNSEDDEEAMKKRHKKEKEKKAKKKAAKLREKEKLKAKKENNDDTSSLG